jgi:glycopeptide antibiotics resistance protein
MLKRLLEGKNTLLITKSIAYAFYLLMLIYLVFIGGDDHRRLHLFNLDNFTMFSYLPFKGKIAGFVSGRIWAYHPFFGFLQDFIGNIILFIPLPLILILGEGMSDRKRIVSTAFVISLSIEITQLITGLGHSDVDDLILNTGGAYLGIRLSNWIMSRPFWKPVEYYLRFGRLMNQISKPVKKAVKQSFMKKESSNMKTA